MTGGDVDKMTAMHATMCILESCTHTFVPDDALVSIVVNINTIRGLGCLSPT